MEKYSVVVKKGKFIGRTGYVLDNKPNEIGCIMWYSKEGQYPYRAVLSFTDVKFIERG